MLACYVRVMREAEKESLASLYFNLGHHNKPTRGARNSPFSTKVIGIPANQAWIPQLSIAVPIFYVAPVDWVVRGKQYSVHSKVAIHRRRTKSSPSYGLIFRSSGHCGPYNGGDVLAKQKRSIFTDVNRRPRCILKPPRVQRSWTNGEHATAGRQTIPSISHTPRSSHRLAFLSYSRCRVLLKSNITETRFATSTNSRCDYLPRCSKITHTDLTCLVFTT